MPPTLPWLGTPDTDALKRSLLVAAYPNPSASPELALEVSERASQRKLAGAVVIAKAGSRQRQCDATARLRAGVVDLGLQASQLRLESRGDRLQLRDIDRVGLVDAGGNIGQAALVAGGPERDGVGDGVGGARADRDGIGGGGRAFGPTAVESEPVATAPSP